VNYDSSKKGLNLKGGGKAARALGKSIDKGTLLYYKRKDQSAGGRLDGGSSLREEGKDLHLGKAPPSRPGGTPGLREGEGTENREFSSTIEPVAFVEEEKGKP